jgi:hypothetical protein
MDMRIPMFSMMALLLAACGTGTPDAAPGASAPQVVAPARPVAIQSGRSASPPAPASTPAFVGTVWHVAPASAQEPGTTYLFLGDGELVVDAPHGTPMRGRWSYVDGKLTMTEEGVTYPTDIVAMDAGHLRLRSHNPGGSVDIVLVAAPDPTAPPGR